MAQLPSKTFWVNYNAKDFDGNGTIPQTQGQTYDKDLVLNSNITSYTSDHITLNGQYYRDVGTNAFNRAGGDSFTIVMKVSQGVDSTGAHAIVANRGNDYNWMVFNPANGSPYGMVFLHSREGDYTKCPYIQMVDTTVPNIFAFRVTGGTGFGKSYTDNQTFTSTGVTWGGSSNSFGIFCGGYSATEFWKGDFYWMYISPEYLTDAEVEEVIAYNEGSSIKAVADNTSFAYSGGIATIDITTNNGWSASTTDNWITLSSSTGSGDTTITATIPSYSGATDRTDTITFTDTTTGDIAEITIKQKKLVNGQPVYLGSNEVTELYLGSSAVTEAYLGTVLVYSSGPFIGLKITTAVSFAKTGGTKEIRVRASENWEILGVPAWLTLSSTAGTSGNTTISATTQDNQTGSALTATLTAYTTNSAYSATCEVEQAYCTPIIISAQTSPYDIATAAKNMGVTEYTDCLWDFTGVKEISDTGSQQYTPRVRTGGPDSSYARNNITYVNLNTSDCIRWDYAFNEMSGLTYIEVDMSSTTFVANFLYGCPVLQTLVINNCPATGVTNFNGGMVNGPTPNLTNVIINGSLPGSCDMQLFYEGRGNICSGLTVTSLNNIIAALPTIGASGANVHTCYLGTVNINKLSAAEQQVAIDKGWRLG